MPYDRVAGMPYAEALVALVRRTKLDLDRLDALNAPRPGAQ